jgi:hypothetical protein
VLGDVSGGDVRIVGDEDEDEDGENDVKRGCGVGQ